MANVVTPTVVDKSLAGEFYGYNYRHDAEGRFTGEAVAGSNAFFFFESLKAFEGAVSAYNVCGNPPVKSASTGRV